jgi:hypothetical protein
MEEICDLRKSCVNMILDDDFNANDLLESTLKMKGNNAKGENFAKMGANFKMTSPEGNLTFDPSTSIEMRLPFWKFNMKCKLKNGRFFEHYDMGFKKCEKQRGEETVTTWHNPYFRWSATTSLTNWAFNLGMASYFCKGFNKRTQLNYDPSKAVDGNSAWSICSRKRFSRGKFWGEGCGGVNLGNLSGHTIKKLRLGWNESNWALVMQLNNIQMFAGGCPLKDSVSLGGCWKQANVGTFVGRIHHFMNDRPSGFEFGFLRKINDKLTVKAKVDQNWNLNMNSKFSCCKEVSVEGSLMSNLADSEKVSGLFELPVKVGLKLKMIK